MLVIRNYYKHSSFQPNFQNHWKTRVCIQHTKMSSIHTSPNLPSPSDTFHQLCLPAIALKQQQKITIITAKESRHEVVEPNYSSHFRLLQMIRSVVKICIIWCILSRNTIAAFYTDCTDYILFFLNDNLEISTSSNWQPLYGNQD